MRDPDTVDPGERRLAAALKSEPEIWTPDCLTPERMIALAERSLPEAEAAPLLAHVALCARCRREYAETDELRQLAKEVPILEAQSAETAPALPLTATPSRQGPPQSPPFWKRWLSRKERAVNGVTRTGFASARFSPGLGFTLGAAAASAALFFAVTTPARVQRDRLAATLRARDAAFARSEEEKQALGRELAALKRQREGDAAHLTRELNRLGARIRSQSVQVARLEASETTLRQLPLPTAEWMLSRNEGQVRGIDSAFTAPEIVLARPVQTAIPETRPVLECRPVPGASAYQARLEIEGSNEEAPALQPLSATQWKPSAPLRPGTVYRWAVTAQRGGALLHSPLVTFYVLNGAQTREVEEARRQYARDPLTLGAVYARLGMLPEAETQFRAAVKIDSNAPVARRWLNELKARRTPR